MRLLIISHTPHSLVDGKYLGWGPTVKEISQLAKYFERITHVAILEKSKDVPISFLNYTEKNIKCVIMKAAGGRGLLSKLGILLVIPQWIREILYQLRKCDMVHIRCPASISLVAILLLIFIRYPKKRWVKYAGNWGQKGGPFGYRLQRFLLHRNFFKGVVTINGTWQGQKKHEISFPNPSLTVEEVVSVRSAVEIKELRESITILFIGRLDEKKGAQYLIEAAELLIKRGYKLNVDIIGGGVYLKTLQQLAFRYKITNNVNFLGWLSHIEAKKSLLRGHFLVLPSCSSEGWPKVLSEAMAYGALCVSSGVSAIPQTIKNRDTGIILKKNSGKDIADVIEEFIKQPDVWKKIIIKANKEAEKFTYEEYLERVKKLF